MLLCLRTKEPVSAEGRFEMLSSRSSNMNKASPECLTTKIFFWKGEHNSDFNNFFVYFGFNKTYEKAPESYQFLILDIIILGI